MGCSIIGHNCDKYIWLSWRWALESKIKGRIKRLFETGHREEERLMQNLRGLGVDLYATDSENDNKQIGVSAVDGHLAGSVDGVGKGFVEAPKTWAVVETKTHNAKSFADLNKKGVKTAKPQHYVQMQMYMGLLELERAMYLAQCKDDDDIYSEWVHFDKETFDTYMERAKHLIGLSTPPEGISTDPAWFECKWCDFYDHCHGDKVAQVNCRTCVHSTPVKEAAWECSEHHTTLTHDKQKEACKQHLYIPALIPFGEVLDAGTNFVQYKVKGTERTFTNSAQPGAYLSREICMLDPSQVGDKNINEMKDIFGAEVTQGLSILDMRDDLEAVYSDDNSAKGKKQKAELAKTAAQVKALKGLK